MFRGNTTSTIQQTLEEKKRETKINEKADELQKDKTFTKSVLAGGSVLTTGGHLAAYGAMVGLGASSASTIACLATAPLSFLGGACLSMFFIPAVAKKVATCTVDKEPVAPLLDTSPRGMQMGK